MTTRMYVTEHTLSGLTDAHLRSMRLALAETSRRLSLSGKPIELVDCTYLPERRLVCTFSAASATVVREAIDLAQLPRPTVSRCLPPDGELSADAIAAPAEPTPEAGVDRHIGS
jgi:hypothetical protein